MNNYELTGVAGIGKSTLYNKLIKRKDFNCETPNKVITDIIKTNFESNSINRRFLIKKDLFKNKHLKWSLEILRDKKWETLVKHSIEYNELINFFIENYNEHNHHPAISKITHFNLLFRHIEYLCYFKEYNIKQTILWDEGAIHHIPYNNEVYEKYITGMCQ